MVETSECKLDRELFVRAAVRTYFAKLWPLLVLCFLGASAEFLLGQPSNGIVFCSVGILLHPMITFVRVRNALESPLNKNAYVNRFTEDAFEQLSGGERRAYIKYIELFSIQEIPEGLRMWVTRRGPWILIQRTAFKSESDFAAVCQLLIAAGKMKPKPDANVLR